MQRHNRRQIIKARKCVIARKRKLCQKLYGEDWYLARNVDYSERFPGELLKDANNRLHNVIPGKYSKGKIHCSCKLCQAYRSGHLKHSNQIRMLSTNQQLKEASYL